MSGYVNPNGPRYPVGYQVVGYQPVYQPPAVVTREITPLPGGGAVLTTTTTQVVAGEVLVAARQVPGARDPNARPVAVVSRGQIPPHSGNNSGNVDFGINARTGRPEFRK